ncbi:MAG: hypothetical protein LBD37_10510 [Treponema sp.]|nr:hypothetical protein [Treponema sp.]
MKKIVFRAALRAALCAAGAYARGSGEISRFTYQENGIGKNAAAGYTGVYGKRMYVSGSGRNARMVIDGAFCPWNGQYGEWERLINWREGGGSRFLQKVYQVK